MKTTKRTYMLSAALSLGLTIGCVSSAMAAKLPGLTVVNETGYTLAPNYNGTTPTPYSLWLEAKVPTSSGRRVGKYSFDLHNIPFGESWKGPSIFTGFPFGVSIPVLGVASIKLPNGKINQIKPFLIHNCTKYSKVINLISTTSGNKIEIGGYCLP